MKNLGKIIILLNLFSIAVFATVTAKVEPRDIYAGDSATYSVIITGSNVKKPELLSICGNDITASSSQTSIVSINGSYKKSYTLSYQFTPKKDCTIAPTEVEIDSKKEFSNSVKVTIKPRTQDLKADFILSFIVPKKEFYIGEPFELTLLLKQHRGVQAVDSKYIAPEFKGFWVKSEEEAQRVKEGDFTITKVVYKLAAQREGTLHIEPAALKIAQRTGVNNWGSFRPQVKWRTYYSNSIDIKSKALPQGVKIVGDFILDATVQKRSVNPNEPVNVKIKVQGEGNLEDIESFKPYLASVNIFDEKIVINKNTLTQKLVFVGDSNFTIPSFTLKYFDLKSDKIRILKTDPIHVTVRGNTLKKELKITRDEPSVEVVKADDTKTVTAENNNYLYIAFAFFVGLIIGIFIMILKGAKGSSKTLKIDMKNEKMLLIKLLPFKDIDSDVSRLVEVLENNIYSKEKQNLDKKLLKEMIKKHDIS